MQSEGGIKKGSNTELILPLQPEYTPDLGVELGALRLVVGNYLIEFTALPE